jgi:aldehyde:ferredoxin oxidoreductase
MSTPGYFGRYLRCDLTRCAAEPVEIPADVLRRFIGGSGLGTWLLLRESGERQDPLAPEAPLVFVFSPLVGSPLTTSAKFAVMCQSPLTGRINDSLSSSHFAIAGKKTGYDAIVVVGAADSLTCLVIEPDRVRFEDASAAQGKSAREASAILGERLGAGFRIAAIGPAGEHLVRFATVSHDGRHAGRGGSGAVMGSKQLKAIAVRGDRQTEFARPDELIRFSKQLSQRSFGPATEKYRELGTVSNLLTFNRLGTLPTRNFQASTFAGAGLLAPEAMGTTHRRTRASCAACTIGCEHIFELAPLAPKGGEGPGVRGDHLGGLLDSEAQRRSPLTPTLSPSGGEGGSQSSRSTETGSTQVRLEYESLFALGPLCGISDPDVVLRAAAACDHWGMDTISAGATVAFAMECAERELIDTPDLRFGNGSALLDLLDAIGSRRGLGELLSLGSRAAAARIGGGSEDFAAHVKGLEIPGYEPRALQTMALGFAVGTRGADHNRSGAYQIDFSTAVDRLHIDESAIPLAIQTEDEAAIMDSLILCKFLRGVFSDKLAEMAGMLNLVTGWDVTAAELSQTAQRIVTAKKTFNIRQGWTPAEDTLPARFLSEPLADGPGIGMGLTRDQLQSLIRAYNVARGWSPEGWPTKA